MTVGIINQNCVSSELTSIQMLNQPYPLEKASFLDKKKIVDCSSQFTLPNNRRFTRMTRFIYFPGGIKLLLSSPRRRHNIHFRVMNGFLLMPFVYLKRGWANEKE